MIAPNPIGPLATLSADVVNAVTLQTQSALVTGASDSAARRRVWTTRVSVAQAEPLARCDGWRTARPITLLSVEKRI